MKCFICGGVTYIEAVANHHICIECGREWVDAGNGEWETVPKPVTLLKKPEEGDNYSDIVKLDK